MNDEYTNKLVDILTDVENWPALRLSDDFSGIIQEVHREISSDSTAGKIAIILVEHQIVHEAILNLTRLSHLYIQGEIWPIIYKPTFPKKEDKMMTGELITYYQSNCIEARYKDDVCRIAKELNNIRNKIAHNLSGKNNTIIRREFNRYRKRFLEFIEKNDACEDYLVSILSDLTKRVEFKEFRSV